jgi:Flp pilus assembly pilin Flp
MYVELCRKLWIAARNLKDDTRGIAALEYAVLAAIVLGLVVAGLSNTDGISGLFTAMNNAIKGATTTPAAGG